MYIRHCPHTGTVYNKATIKGLICPYYEYYLASPKVYIRFKVCGLSVSYNGFGFRV